MSDFIPPLLSCHEKRFTGSINEERRQEHNDQYKDRLRGSKKEPRITRAALPPPRGGRDPEAPSSPAPPAVRPKHEIAVRACGGRLRAAYGRSRGSDSSPCRRRAHGSQSSPLYFLQPLKFLENIFAIFLRGQLTNFLPRLADPTLRRQRVFGKPTG